MAKGARKKKTDRTTPDATENKNVLLDNCSATSGSESRNDEQVSDRLRDLTHSSLSQDELVVDQQHGNEDIHEPPPASDIIVQSYEGETHNGKMHGEGVAHFQGGHVYKGTFSEGLLQGYGLFTWQDGVTYEGQFVANVPMGHGKYTWLDGSSYEGDIYNAIRHGVGTYRCANTPVLYRGQWHRGKRHGKGVVCYNQDETSWYDGDWEENKREGWGVRRYPSGNVYEGEWKDDARHGRGTMRWLALGEEYVGAWRHGVQHGHGTHTWFIKRPLGSQYPKRNQYQGEFVSGERQGRGTFCYAIGETYEGDWRKNEKHGQGKYTFTNGRSIEREFVDDRMVEFPPSGGGGSRSPRPHHIRPDGPTHRLPGQGYGSLLGPYMELDVDFLLEKFPESTRPSEHQQVELVVLRHLTELTSIYSFYSRLGHSESPDNVFLLSRLQYWRLLLDCKVHHHHGSTLVQLDRLMPGTLPGEIVSPYTSILLPSLISSLVSIAYHTYHQALGSQRHILAECYVRLMQDNVLPHAKSVKGFLFSDVQRVGIAMSYMETCWGIYQAMSEDSLKASPSHTVTWRQLLLMFKDLNLFDTQLTTGKLLDVIRVENPDTSNLEEEVSFLEFFQVLLGCADVKRAEEPRPWSSPDPGPPNRRASPAGGSPPRTPTLLPQTMEKSMEALTSSSLETSEGGVKHHRTEPTGAAEAGAGELDAWIQRTHLFFSRLFFPAYEHRQRLLQEVQDHRRRQTAQQRIALAKANEKARTRERLRAEEEERRRREAEKRQREEDDRRREEEEEGERRGEEEEAGSEEQVGGPSPGAQTPVGSSSPLAPTGKRKQLTSKGGL